MNVAITQPSYIPWRGAFHLIQRSDVFVFFDDVQYTRRSWRNRNRIKGPRDVRWLSVPVHSRGLHREGTPIHRIAIDWEQDWARSHREKIKQCYLEAPCYRSYEALLDRLYAGRPALLADFTIETTVALARELGIRHTRFLRSSELTVSGEKTERVLAILREVGATHFINGPTARAYTDEALLRRAGLSLEYMRYDYPPYPQLHEPFTPEVSILDLLFMVGKAAPRYIWDR